jgi:hypothetical protein
MIINIRKEVESLLGRKMTRAEERTFKSLRYCGYANPYDIERKLKE